MNIPPLLPTISCTRAAEQMWDVAVVGAGPAGALAAHELARRGATVLLVDHAEFPRSKVCGCCLSGAAIATLQAVGLGSLPETWHAIPLTTVQLAAGTRRARLSLPHGVALSREALDTALIQAAIQAGAAFLPNTRAMLADAVSPSTRPLVLQQRQASAMIEARVVLAADGLSGTLLQHRPEFRLIPAPNSLFSIGAIATDAPAAYAPGTIYMTGARHGYVGMVRLEDGRLNIAAAMRPAAVRSAKNPGIALADILEEARMPSIDGLQQLPWHGTPSLTCRRTSLAAERLFVLGDAAGYVEPFTGEGIGWALACAVTIAPLVVDGLNQWHPTLCRQWNERYHRLLGQRQQRCWLIAQLLRQPTLMRIALAILSVQPGFGSPILRALNAPLVSPA